MQIERFRILIVEDNPADLYLYSLLLKPSERIAFEQVEAPTGREGLDACKKAAPDCIVLDFHLPDMDGLEFISRLKQQCGDLPCPVVMLTGVRDELVAVRAMTSGATDYIPKGEDLIRVLVPAITGAIEKFRLRRKVQEQQISLEASERQYRTLMEALPQLVWCCDAAGAIEYANRRWCEYTGFMPTSGLTLTEVIVPEDRARYAQAWEQAVSAQETFELELRLIKAYDKCERWHLIRLAPMQGRAAAEFSWIGTGTDIEDLKQAETMVRQKQKWESIGLLAGGIAHDFNNLLVGILGGASLASESLPARHPVQSTLQVIVTAGERAAQLTRQMLAYAGRGPSMLGPVNMSDVVRETRELVKASIPAHVTVNLELAPDLPVFEADRGQIQQIVMNLLINAAEAIPDRQSGVVTVRTFAQAIESGTAPPDWIEADEMRSRDLVVLEVQDTGCGMDEGTKAKIFDPFFTTKFMGRGLGLAAVQGIIRTARGGIAVNSSPNEGSTFRVFFPAGASPAKTEPAKSEQLPASGGTGTSTVLVIDDEEDVRKIVRMALEREGLKVITADGGREGLRILQENHSGISLVLLDMSMPGMGGDEVLRSIRSSGIEIPVAVCSGYSETEVTQRFAGYDFQAFIQKPFKVNHLAEKVREILN